MHKVADKAAVVDKEIGSFGMEIPALRWNSRKEALNVFQKLMEHARACAHTRRCTHTLKVLQYKTKAHLKDFFFF